MNQFENVKDTAMCWYGNAKDGLSGYLEGQTVKTRRQAWITGTMLFLMGVVIGFLISPIKKGISVCSNNVDSFSSNEAYDNNQATGSVNKTGKKRGFAQRKRD